MTNRVYVTISLVVVVLATLAQAQTFKTLYSFAGGSDGGNPYAGVIQDPSGNLYGTTSMGGYLKCQFDSAGCGVVYKLDTARAETVLHTFTGSTDGYLPYTPVIRDSAGNIYGTTSSGLGGTPGGTVFRIDSAGNESVMYQFTGHSDGCDPLQGVIRDSAGNLYGTTANCGGALNNGTIFKVDSAGNFTLLHTFGGTKNSGGQFYGHLEMDSSGNLYGVTTHGASGYGELYKLSKSGTYTVLHSFAGGTSDGCYPYGSVTRDTYGNLYGTTIGCGSHRAGTIWKVSKTSKETILHNFAGGMDGGGSYAGVTRDSKGNLYGVTYGGGKYGDGELYKLSTTGKLILLHSFDNSDGWGPVGEVLRTTKGTLYGTTVFTNYPNGYGTVWKYVP